MAPQAQAPAERYPPIQWQSGDSHLIWLLLTEAERDENRIIVFGKRAGESSSADKKNTVYKRIAEKVIPDAYTFSPGMAGERVRGKLEGLIKDYKTHLKSFEITGGGVSRSGESRAGSRIVIPPEGPDEDTSDEGKNIWQKVLQKFPFYPRLHLLLSERPNVVPPMITTGTGPDGRETVFSQPVPQVGGEAPASQQPAPLGPRPSLANIDPTLHDVNVNNVQQSAVRPPAPPSSSAPSQENQPPPSQQKTGPKASTISTAGKEKLALAVEKANIKTIPAKRTIEDRLYETQQAQLQLVERRLDAEQEEKRQKIDIEKRALYLREFEANLISRDEYRALVYPKLGQPSTSQSSNARLRRRRSFSDDDESEQFGGNGSVGEWEF